MVAGVTQAAPVTLTTKADITELRDLRRNYAGSPMPSITDLILLAVARCLRDHPMLQAQWRDEHLFVPAGVHVALAVDSEHGLQVPVIRDADRLTLPEIVTQTRAAIGAARSSLLPVDATRGATFTITNLGMYGIDQFTPIIPLPQCAILGVGRIVREPALIEERIAIRDMMTLSLTFDHRIVDGAPAARFLDALRRELEQPRLHR
jgi:pyruvate dehydrogenase E2 component (dihydrolipoamide acetyltransferase)